MSRRAFTASPMLQARIRALSTTTSGAKKNLLRYSSIANSTAINQSLSLAVGKSARDQLKEHFEFLTTEPPTVEVAPLQLLATFAAEAPAIPLAITQRIARGTDIWITHVSDLISLAQTESGTPTAQESHKAGVTAGHLLVRSDRS